MAQATLLNEYGYDLITQTYVQPGMVTQARVASIKRARSLHPQDDLDIWMQQIARTLANAARTNGTRLANVGKVVGLTAGLLCLVEATPLLISVAVVGGIASYVGTSSGAALGLAFDQAAALARPSPTPEANYKAVLPTLNYVAAHTTSTFVDATFDPVDGLATDVLRKVMAPADFLAYQSASLFVTAESGDFGTAVMNTAQTFAATDPATSAIDKAVITADSQVVSPSLINAALSASDIAQINAGASSADLDTLVNSMNTLANALIALSATPDATEAYPSSFAAFSTCSQGLVDDILAIASSIGPNGPTDTEMSQLTNDIQSLLSCGSVLVNALNMSAASATDTQTETIDGLQYSRCATLRQSESRKVSSASRSVLLSASNLARLALASPACQAMASVNVRARPS